MFTDLARIFFQTSIRTVSHLNWAQSREAFERLRIAGDPVPRRGWGQVIHMGGSINGGIQKWLVYNGKSYIYIYIYI